MGIGERGARTATPAANALSHNALSVIACRGDQELANIELHNSCVPAPPSGAGNSTGYCAKLCACVAGGGLRADGTTLTAAAADGLEKDGGTGLSFGDDLERVSAVVAEIDAASIAAISPCRAHREAGTQGIGRVARRRAGIQNAAA